MISSTTGGSREEQILRSDMPVGANIERIAGPVKIETRDLDVYYGGTQAIKHVSLQVAERQVTALMGPSGCGKSTFLRALNRMHDLTPSARVTGTVTLDGADVYAADMDVVHLRQRVGMVFQRPNPFPKSIFENVAYGLKVQGGHGKSALRETVERSLRDAALWDEVKDRLDQSAL